MADDSVQVLVRTTGNLALLRRCFDSIINQTHENWSICLLVDAEPNLATEVLSWVSQLPVPYGVRVCPHLVVASGRWGALEDVVGHCEHRYFAIHDDDDSWDPRFLERVVRLASQHPESAVIKAHSTCVFEEWAGNCFRPVGVSPWSSDERIDFLSLAHHNQTAVHALLWTTKAFLNRRRLVSFRAPYLMDWVYLLEVVRDWPIAVLPEPLARYHIRIVSDGALLNSVGLRPERMALERVIQREILQHVSEAEAATLSNVFARMQDPARIRANLSDLLEMSRKNARVHNITYNENVQRTVKQNPETLWRQVFARYWRSVGHLLSLRLARRYESSLRFNPARYLELNSDVLRNREDPLVHFVREGCLQGGRWNVPLPTTWMSLRIWQVARIFLDPLTLDRLFPTGTKRRTSSEGG